jgi:acyl-CoA dehydrogenase
VRASVEDPAWFTAQHAAERDRIREVLAREVAPHAQAWESQRFVGAEGWRALADAGLLSLPHDGEGFLVSALFLEELGELGFAGVRAAVAVHAYMASSYIARFGSDALRQACLPAVRSGRRIAALAMTEENAGSDLRHLTTRATWDDDAAAYRVQGTKLHVANGSQAGLFVTLARTGGRFGAGPRQREPARRRRGRGGRHPDSRGHARLARR